MPRTRRRTTRQPKKVENIRHDDATRPNLPSAEHQSLMADDEQSPIQVAYQRRNRDLDPQLVWRGKDEQDESDLLVQAPPLYIQERVHPKVLIDDLMRQSKENRDAVGGLFVTGQDLTSNDHVVRHVRPSIIRSDGSIPTGYNQCMSKMLDRNNVLGTLREHKPMLKELFGITQVALYGSFARDEATEESDIDVVVEFEGRPTLLTYGSARVYIENIFGRSADLCQLRELRKEVRPNVERELINV